MPKSIQHILREFREEASSGRELGDRFERLMVAFFRTDSLYAELFSNVWIWGEWPGRNKSPDTGIDIVAEERATHGLWAIQCKFYSPEYALQKEDIDSFFTASGKVLFSNRMIVCTTDRWSKHAEEALKDQHPPVARLRVQDLGESGVDWSTFSMLRPDALRLREKKKLRMHQEQALEKVRAGFKKADRGKLIMACGTGKTFTTLRLTEDLVGTGGTALFLVPSISLLGQSLREWTAEAESPLRTFAVCSDTKVTKEKSDSEDIQVHDLGFPATTDPKRLLQLFEGARGKKLNVVFATYQSINVVAEAQKRGIPDFDLVICDEAHRTTGVTLAGEDESHFVRVHDQKFLKAKKRLYMTATPRIYSDDAQVRAKEADATLCSMDNSSLYGAELHRLDFSEAVRRGLLSDYKVMVLAVDEKYVGSTFQKQLAGADGLRLDDYVKITGCWNGLSKRFIFDEGAEKAEADSTPMRRAVAFCSSIKASKQVKTMFASIIEQYKANYQGNDGWLACQVDHVDGTMNALERNRALDWLKEDTSGQGNVCRILSNARCLAEGVDVPALDAVMFLNPRNSVVDVVQSVGRVMRKAPGKRFGYIILPIGVPSGVPPEEALKDHQKYRVVWQVLQALRAHDNRFNATINQIELNERRPDQIQVVGVGGETDDGAQGVAQNSLPKARQMALPFPDIEQWKDAIYARIVLKCGDRRYWETWAKDVAGIAERHIERIKALLEKPKPKHRKGFDEFLQGLRTNLNPNVTEGDAIEMLAQHLITKPVFEAIFQGYDFTSSNPVSVAMQKMLDILEEQSLAREQDHLSRFYDSVKDRVKDIDNSKARQSVIKELYEEFFKAAFPRVAERLGIVYTPIELVDFIVKGADDALHREFGVGLTDRGVHILDPFTGTGTFIARLLQNGLIRAGDLNHKYGSELHANEIALLAYYIAAVNIEEAYHSLSGEKYRPFDGIVLTDTFQMTEKAGALYETMFPENNARVRRQRGADIRVVIGNPPYSVGQDSANERNQNLSYPKLDEDIQKSYAASSTAVLKRNLYDSYVRAIRWATDRIGSQGIICFVTNSSFVDKNAFDGVRKCLAEDFTAIYCLNLRGDSQSSGEIRRAEGGNVFGEGTKTGVAVTLFVKNPAKKGSGCELYYHDIGDRLSRDEKLAKIAQFATLTNVPWSQVEPNTAYDWINQRNPAFARYVPLGVKDDDVAKGIFSLYSLGVVTSRDAWACNYSKRAVVANMGKLIEFYNAQVKLYKAACGGKSKEERPDVDQVVEVDPKRISWSRGLKNEVKKHALHQLDPKAATPFMYRPFCKHWLYYDRHFNEMVLQMPRLFPVGTSESRRNLAISIVGPGARQDFSALMVDTLPCLHLSPDGAQCFPLYYFDAQDDSQAHLFCTGPLSPAGRQEAISDATLPEFRSKYGPKVTKEDIFYYVYGVLHLPSYKQRFRADLKRMLPRIPYLKDFPGFVGAGRALAKWHLEYETVKPYAVEERKTELDLGQKSLYRVERMTFGKKDKAVDKSVILYNKYVSLSEIPLEAYEYQVHGRSAIEWIMDRYQVMVDRDSGIRNDPNDYSQDPRYILDLVKRIVRVSMETIKIVKALPPLDDMP